MSRRAFPAALTLLLAGVLSSSARATPPAASRAPQHPAADVAGQEAERRLRVMTAVGLADALDLDAPQALKLWEKVKQFEDRRQGAQDQVLAANAQLKDASAGGVDGATIDAAVTRMLDGRAQLAAMDRELYTALSVGLDGPHKAKLALFVGRLSGSRLYFRTRPGGPQRSGPGLEP